MSEKEIIEYLSSGGKLSAPENAPPRYRAELLRIMASFVDSELAGAAGFADLINEGPGIKERITAARIVLEKLDHAERVLKIMRDFGVATERYMKMHPWARRVGRDEELGSERLGWDMRLNVFYYPLEGWADAVVMNVLMGSAGIIQLGELSKCSYQPLSEAFSSIAERETRHMELGKEGVLNLLKSDTHGASKIKPSFDYWMPRVEASFGGRDSTRFELLKSFGLRHRQNTSLADEWRQEAARFFNSINI